jgi:hypothetical protein
VVRVYPCPERAPIMIAMIRMELAEWRRMKARFIGQGRPAVKDSPTRSSRYSAIGGFISKRGIGTSTGRLSSVSPMNAPSAALSHDTTW